MEAAKAEGIEHTAKGTSKDVASEAVVHDCCGDRDDMECPEMQTCYGCNTNCHLFSLLTPTFTVPAERTLHPTFNPPALALFDPATVWRPPTNS